MGEPTPCNACGTTVVGRMADHLLFCPGQGGRPDWGCRKCGLVWIGPWRDRCSRCFSFEIGKVSVKILATADDEGYSLSKPEIAEEHVMPKGQSTKGYKMTKNRKELLEILVAQDGAVRAEDGRATAMLSELMTKQPSGAALNAVLRELESLGFIYREVEGRRTYAIAITAAGREAINAAPEKPETPATFEEYKERKAAAAETSPAVTQPVAEDEWEFEAPAIPDNIDYETLAMVLIQKAYHGMQQSSNAELDYYKQQNELAMAKIATLEAEVEKYRSEAVSAVAERDQLQQNMNLLMAKMDRKPRGGTDSIRDRLSDSERKMLDQLMRTLPTRRGD